MSEFSWGMLAGIGCTTLGAVLTILQMKYADYKQKRECFCVGTWTCPNHKGENK